MSFFCKFYVTYDEEKVAKPEGRSAVASNYTRIGLGLAYDILINISENYFANSSSLYTYTFPTSASASRNTKQVDLTTNKVDSHGDADTAYEAYLAE